MSDAKEESEKEAEVTVSLVYYTLKAYSELLRIGVIVSLGFTGVVLFSYVNLTRVFGDNVDIAYGRIIEGVFKPEWMFNKLIPLEGLLAVAMGILSYLLFSDYRYVIKLMEKIE